MMTRRTLLARILLAGATTPLLHSSLHAAQQRDDRTQWNTIYGAADFPYKTEHNAFLASIVESRTPGTALDVGMGRGRNSLYLASKGWQVTGVDISDEGLRIAAEESKKAGLNYHAVRQDFSTFDVGTACWDLIAGIYMGDLMIYEASRLISGLKPGGLLVIENFARDINQPARVGGAPLGYTANQILAVYSALRVRRYEDTVGVADWGRQGREVPVVRFVGERM